MIVKWYFGVLMKIIYKLLTSCDIEFQGNSNTAPAADLRKQYIIEVMINCYLSGDGHLL
jgi:hypothetical protein